MDRDRANAATVAVEDARKQARKARANNMATLSDNVEAREAHCPDCGSQHKPAHEIRMIDGKMTAVEKGWKCPGCKNWKERNVTFDKVSWKVISSPMRVDIAKELEK